MAMNRSEPARARGNRDNRSRKPSRASRHGAELQPVITFTGNRRNDHYEAIVRGEAVELPLACLKALIALVLARAGAGQGFIRLRSVTICRLRRAIDKATELGAGKTLIETGNGDEYRLAVPPTKLHVELALSSCFLELFDLGVVSQESLAGLTQIIVK